MALFKAQEEYTMGKYVCGILRRHIWRYSMEMVTNKSHLAPLLT